MAVHRSADAAGTGSRSEPEQKCDGRRGVSPLGNLASLKMTSFYKRWIRADLKRWQSSGITTVGPLHLIIKLEDTPYLICGAIYLYRNRCCGWSWPSQITASPAYVITKHAYTHTAQRLVHLSCIL